LERLHVGTLNVQTFQRANVDTPKTSLLVIGCGSTLHSDDGVGQVAAHIAESRGWPGVRAIATLQLLPEHALEIAEAGAVVFVDAYVAQSPADETRVSELAPDPAQGMSPHYADPRAMLALAQALYGRAPRAWLIAIPGANFELGEKLSPQTERGLNAALGELKIKNEELKIAASTKT
jgi:hydrogenase maturation protease